MKRDWWHSTRSRSNNPSFHPTAAKTQTHLTSGSYSVIGHPYSSDISSCANGVPQLEITHTDILAFQELISAALPQLVGFQPVESPQHCLAASSLHCPSPQDPMQFSLPGLVPVGKDRLCPWAMVQLWFFSLRTSPFASREELLEESQLPLCFKSPTCASFTICTTVTAF